MDASQQERLASVFKALADPARLRILGLLAEKPRAGHELAASLTLTPPTISHHMRKLMDAGLVDVATDAQSRIYSLRVAALRELSASGPPAHPDSSGDEASAVLRAFFDRDRLRQIPAARKKRVIVLRHLLRRFDPDRSYSEREVNDILRIAHDDVATLRRELVDYGFMQRERGIYSIAQEPPQRGATVRQEVGDETNWLQSLILDATNRVLMPEQSGSNERPPVPPE
ncbi:MAG: metalloregulator ArsR/SmtB family transcription factor [Thermomicrobiales bacterium]